MAEKKLALNRVHQVDCVAALGQVSPGTVDLVFADPPFNIGYKYDVYDDRKQCAEYLAWSKEWIGGVYEALKATGAFWLAIGDDYAAELKVASQDIGFHCRSWVVWYYTFGVNCTRKFTRSHTHLFHFVKDPNNFTFNDTSIRVPSARQLVYADNRANPRGRLPDDTWILRPQDCVDGFTTSEDTWYFPRVAGTFKERAGFHGCQMPEQLLGRIIRCCSNPGELVLDPFAGSGSTLVVAKKLERKCLGFELSKEYAERSQARIDAVEAGDPLDGAAEPLVSAPKSESYEVPKERSKPLKVAKQSKAKIGAEEQPEELQTEEGMNGHAKRNGKSPAKPGKPSDLREAIVEAFSRTSHGYSADRLVADPELDQEFLDCCRKLGAPGTGADLNRALFRLRKMGALAHIVTTRRTEYDWTTLDQFIFASEIAWAQLTSESNTSLDDLLCDPDQATRFDRIALNFAPGFTPLDFRWGALRLRKEAKIARERAKSLRLPKLGDSLAVTGFSASAIPETAGLYLVSSDEETSVYGGSTHNLRARLRQHFTGTPRESWQRQGRKLAVQFVAISSNSTPAEDGAKIASRLHAYRLLLIKRHRPALNVVTAAAVAVG